MTRTWILGALAAAAAVVGGCLGGDDSDKAGGERAADAVVLTLANHEPTASTWTSSRARWSACRTDPCGSSSRTRWREGEVDYEPRTIEDVRDGKVDLAKISARAFDVVGVKSLQPLVAPFAVDSYALQREVLRSGLRRANAGAASSAWTWSASRCCRASCASRSASRARWSEPPTTAARRSPPACPSWACAPSARLARPARPSCRAATRRPSTAPRLGSPASRATTTTVRARTLAANVNLWPRALAIVMNRDAYERLSDDQREALRAAGRAAIDPAHRAHPRVRERGAGHRLQPR